MEIGSPSDPPSSLDPIGTSEGQVEPVIEIVEEPVTELSIEEQLLESSELPVEELLADEPPLEVRYRDQEFHAIWDRDRQIATTCRREHAAILFEIQAELGKRLHLLPTILAWLRNGGAE